MRERGPTRRTSARRQLTLVLLLSAALFLTRAAVRYVEAVGSADGADVTIRADRGPSLAVPKEWRVTKIDVGTNSTTYPNAAAAESIRFGTSAGGRPLQSVHVRGAHPKRSVMVVGVIHGDETAGRAVTDAIARTPLPDDLDLWIVPTINPDGEALGWHGNADQVDLNRNFPINWETGTVQSTGKYFSGIAPASAPETAATMQLIATVRPDVVVWYHSPWDRVDCDEARVGTVCQVFATRINMSLLFSPRPGTATDWILTDLSQPDPSRGIRRTASFVVEFGESVPTADVVSRHVDALLALGS